HLGFALPLYNGTPSVLAHLEEKVVANDAGAAHEHIEPAELARGSPDHVLDLLPTRDVACDSETADRICYLLSRRDVHIGHDHVRALTREELGGRSSNPATSAGDQRNADLEPHLLSVSNAAPASSRQSGAPEGYPSCSPTMSCGRAKYVS